MAIAHKITLPFPPSVNGLYGGGSGQKRFPSKRYKAWLAKCPHLDPLLISRPITVYYTFAWPDKRLRDGQNFMKAVLDYLVNCRVIQDDNYNIVISETWKHIGVDKGNPRVEVEIEFV